MINLKSVKSEILKNQEHFKKFLPINKDNITLLVQELDELTTGDIIRIFDLFD